MTISSHVTHAHLYSNNTLTQRANTNNMNGIELSATRFSMQEQSFSYSSTSLKLQNSFMDDTFEKNHEAFQSFLNDIGYNGQSLAQLSQENAAALVDEEGFFGISQTAERIAGFVISGSRDDEDRFRSGREGMLQGFEDAKTVWGGELPEISQKTMERATKMVDEAMHALGFSIINEAI